MILQRDPFVSLAVIKTVALHNRQNMVGPTATSTPRIPLALQQIFLASQRGEDVEKIEAPKGGMGFRIFRRFGGRYRGKTRPVKAPTTSSLHSERSETTRETAADASRRAISMKNNEKKQVSLHVSDAASLDLTPLGGYLFPQSHLTSLSFTFALPIRLQISNHHKPFWIELSKNVATRIRNTVAWRVDTTVAQLLCNRPVMEAE